MLRSVDDWGGEHFDFVGSETVAVAAPLAVTIDHGTAGSSATIPDAHLLFSAQFSRAGADLVLRGDDLKTVIVRDYFATDEHARLLSPEGAALSADVVKALAGPLAPGQYAQGAAATAPARIEAVGRVAQASGEATVLRNGVAVTAHAGDAIQKGDVLQTVGGSLGVTFNDGSTLDLTPNSRLVVNEFVYSPNGSSNSQLLNLVQGSLTFISGEVAHSGDMRIGTPVATMGIRGTVGGVTTANDGTVRFYVSQSATGAVILDSHGTVIANVTQDGPVIQVRPAGPQQVIADEVQKTPAQLAIELAALQHIVNIQAVGQQILQQFFQQDKNNPKGPDQPHTQIPINLLVNPHNTPNNGTGLGNTVDTGNVFLPHIDTSGPTIIDVIVPPDLPPLNFGPLHETVDEDGTLVFSKDGHNAITVFDTDTAVLTVTLSVSHGVLTLSGVAGLTFLVGNGTGNATMTFTGTLAAINAALDGLIFKAAKDYNGAASITIATGDGTHTTTDTIDIVVAAVNDAPVIEQSGSPSHTYTENGDPVAVDTVLKLSDIDNATLTGATVKISGGFHAGEDILKFSTQNGISGSYNAHTGVLTLTGVASVADYQAALRSITYYNRNDNPGSGVRTITFQVYDGSGVDHSSNTVTGTITVVAVNDAPVIEQPASPSHTYTENGAPVAIDTVLKLSDVDNQMLSGATVTISGGFHAGQDVLNFSGGHGISGVYNAQTGVLTLTGVASVADYQAALRSITYLNNSDNPLAGNRTITFQVDDGSGGTSNTVTGTITVTAVNDAPVITQDGSPSHTYTDIGSSVAIDNVLTLSDVDNHMLSGATVKISGGFHAGEDILKFTAQNGISGSYNVHTGVLTLTGMATVTDYEAALRSITYYNRNDNPGSGTRTITFQVDDGSGVDHSSNIVTATVVVDAHAPEFDANSLDLTIAGTVPQGTVVGTVYATDADGDTITYSIVSGNDDHMFSVDSHGNIIFNGEGEGPVVRDLVIAATDTGSRTDTITVHIGEQDTGYGASITMASAAGVEIMLSPYGATSGFKLPGAGNVTTPGTQEDRIVLGYHIDVEGVDQTEVRNNAPMLGEGGMTPISTSFSVDAAGSHSTVTMAAGHDVTLSQTIDLGADANFFTTTISIHNGSDFDLHDVRFMRNIDPDQDHDLYGDYETDNDVIQNPNGDNLLAAVSATGTHSGATVMLIGVNGNWHASSYGFTNNDPYDPYAFDDPQDPNGARGDHAISLTDLIGTIHAGDDVKISYITTANVATTGSNALIGGTGCDTIDGLGGKDLLFGLAGADTFIFKHGYGAGTVADFSLTGGDKIDLADFHFNNFAQLENHLHDVVHDGVHDTLIDLGGGVTVTLNNVNLHDLTGSDFIFGHPV